MKRWQMFAEVVYCQTGVINWTSTGAQCVDVIGCLLHTYTLYYIHTLLRFIMARTV